MRCPDCNKFVAYDTEADPEEEGDSMIDGSHTDGYTFRASYRRILPCAECSPIWKVHVQALANLLHADTDGPALCRVVASALAQFEDDDEPIMGADCCSDPECEEP